MQVLWLLALRRFRRRRAVSTITASATAPATPSGYVYYGEDDGPFFDLDLSSCCCSAPASSGESSSSSESEDSSSCAGAREADLVISLQRSCSASPSYERLSFGSRCGWGGALPPQLKFCASEPNDAAAARFSASSSRRGRLRTLSFGSAKAAFYGGRASFSSSTRSARLFASAYAHGSPSPDQDHEEEAKRTPSADVIRRCLSRISRRLRRVAPPAADLRGLRKSRSASAAQTATPRAQVSSPSRRDDTLLEKQDGIASAIAHCKESIHRASMSELDSSLLRTWSDPGT